ICPENGASLDGSLKLELEKALTVAERANNATLRQVEGRWTIQGDPTEGALVVAARKAGFNSVELSRRYPRIAEIPFSSVRKLMSTVHDDAENPDHRILMVKGAPDVLLARCTHELVGEEVRPLTDERRAAIQEANEKLAGEALRTLAVAFRYLPKNAEEDFGENAERDLTFLALFGLIDPPLLEARDAVLRAKGAGIRPIMITGDHPKTAAIIASEVGIAPDARTVTGVEISQMSDDQLDRTLRDVSVYARVNPEHKLRIVKALQRQGLTVAVTGD